LKLVILKKAGEPGDVAINPERVTHVRTGSGVFTDIFFGDHRVAVQGTFQEVVARLSGPQAPAAAEAPRNWFPAR
jgi:hypothetical protein